MGVEPVTVVIVDDHPMVREGLKTFLGLTPQVEVVGEAGSVEEALGLVRELAPRVVLCDLVLPGRSGAAAIRALADASPRSRIVVLTSFGDGDRAQEALRAGATSYLLKTVSPEDLVSAIQLAAHGRAVLDSAPVATPRRLPSGEELTPREQEVLELMGQGLDNRDIAARLVISVKTVKTHQSRIYEKLGVGDRTQAVVAGAVLGLIHLRGAGED
jgi:NarL family two-component system response regulator LiaR